MFNKVRVSKRHVLLFTIAAALCLSFMTASAQRAMKTPILASAPNFRDLAGIAVKYGGTGFAETTSNGGVMRTGVFYRSDALNNLSNQDFNTISSLGIVRDIDLRTPDEIHGSKDSPPIPPAHDRVPRGATWTNINIFGTNRPEKSPISGTPEYAIRFMEKGYRAFVDNQTQRKGFREVLLTLAKDSGPDLWHCTGGKDRTGWTAVLLQSIAGVPRATIMRDYLATNSYTAEAMSAEDAYLVKKYGFDRATLDALLGVKSCYLQAGLDEVTAMYGSMYGYLTRGLGLSRADIHVLRARMVYYPRQLGQSGSSGNGPPGATIRGSKTAGLFAVIQ